MTGTQSLSVAQLHEIKALVDRQHAKAMGTGRYAIDSNEQRVYFGQPVSVVIHQAEPFTNGDKRVDVHKAFSDTLTVWIDRDGKQVRRFGG